PNAYNRPEKRQGEHIERPGLARAQRQTEQAMTDNAYTAVVPKDIADLVPVFLNNRKKELEALRTALVAQDFAQLRQLGHRMKGVGNSYGFSRVSDLGKSIEEGAASEDRAALDASIDEYADYLARVNVVYE
ncbi:MAG: Hpt domain-containing protein, partial [Burkholderiales bacterium]